MSLIPVEIGDPAQDRYASLRLIPWWDQERLIKARVMVVGAGALGNEVLKDLALLGVGRILVVDMDRVEASNLSRAVLFRMDDSGRLKAEVAAGAARAINPGVRIAAFSGDLTRELGLGVYRRVDVVLGCLDNRAARRAVSRACFRTGTPWIDGALDILQGSVRTFLPPEGPCYECGMSPADYADANIRYSCTGPAAAPAGGRIPTTPTSAAIVAAIQVQQAVKRLHGEALTSGQGVFFDGGTLQLTRMSYSVRADCPGHDDSLAVLKPTSLPARASVLTLGQLLDFAEPEAGPNPTLLLEREVVRHAGCPRCKTVEALYRPYDLLVPEGLRCPRCGGNRVPDLTAHLGRDPDAQALPLAQLGIPPLHVVIVEGERRRVSLELAGDEPEIFSQWST